ncbi:hypothetical protein AtNW77_Chr4g0278921 [Arabidopsis thaliana]
MVDDDEAEDNDDEAKDIKLWVKSQLSSIRHEFAESVKKLRSQNLNLLKKIRVLQSVKSYRSRPFTRHPSKKDEISRETCKDSVCSPQKHLDETPSMKTCKDSVDSPQKHLHLPSPRPPVVFDTATKPSPNDVTEIFFDLLLFSFYFEFLRMDVTHMLMLYLFYRIKEIKIPDLSLAENVDTLLDTVCKNRSSSVAAPD